MNGDENCKKVTEWLLNDQFSYGEWGKSELEEGETRSEKTSRIKPNVFSSIYAVNVLKILGADISQEEVVFRRWLSKLRNREGFFLGKGAKKNPFGDKSSWDTFINLRHTMKGLDYLFREKLDSFEDVQLFHELLKFQKSDGSFSQSINGNSDVWSTAYFINLMITVLEPDCLPRFKTRERSEEQIRSEFNQKKDKAIIWVLEQIKAETFWDNDEDKEYIILALMAQIGSAVLKYDKGSAADIFHQIFNLPVRRKYTRLFVLSLGFPVLNAIEQKNLLSEIQDLLTFDKIDKVDLVEVGSFGYLNYFGQDMGLLQYYCELNNMHELVCPIHMVKQTTYFNWCIKKYRDLSKEGDVSRKYRPVNKADVWNFVYNLLIRYKKIIENERGWENLWENNKKNPVNEKKVQSYFWSSITMYLENQNIKYSRETETGSGPVDFSFDNGISTKVFVEFKLASNSSVRRDSIKQIKSYMRTGRCDSACVVVVGFYSEDSSVMEMVDTCIEEAISNDSQDFIQSIYIDASVKTSASKLHIVNET